MSQTLLKKITTRAVVGDVPKMVKAGEIKTGPVMRVMGQASGFETGESNYGEWVALKGDFEATNIMTGDVFRAGKCFVPETVQNLVVEQIKNEQRNEAARLAGGSLDGLEADVVAEYMHEARNSANVMFAIDVEVRVDDTLPTGFEYIAKPLVQESADPFARLRDQVPDLPALAAPKKASAKKAAS